MLINKLVKTLKGRSGKGKMELCRLRDIPRCGTLLNSGLCQLYISSFVKEYTYIYI